MEIFENRAKYMDTELSFRLKNDCIIYSHKNCLNDTEKSSLTLLNESIVSLPQSLANQYDM